MDLTRFFEPRPVGRRIEDLETPVPLIDIDRAAGNLMRWQQRCTSTGRRGRSHIKTHKLTGMAKAQLALGAGGIAVQKLGEAEVMADAGITAMLLTFNVVGAAKLDRLTALMTRSEIAVVADNEPMIAGLAHAAGRAGRRLDVLVECDTGGKRNGVQSPQAALALAQTIDRMPDLSFAGFLTHGRAGGRVSAAEYLAEARELAQRSGLDVRNISAGGSPDMWSDDGLADVTEYRVGTYIYFDRSHVARGTCASENCALTVLTTVVSTPTSQRSMIDAGSKALTSDLLGLDGYGIAQDLDGAKVYQVDEEHGYLDTSAMTRRPKVGDRLRITPNHACPVSNLFDEVVLVRGNEVLGAVKVEARGKVQ